MSFKNYRVNSAIPVPVQIKRAGLGATVVTTTREQYVPNADCIVRAGPGQKKCTICGGVMDAKWTVVERHLASKKHLDAVRARA